MTSKRLKKLLMGNGFSRNKANEIIERFREVRKEEDSFDNKMVHILHNCCVDTCLHVDGYGVKVTEVRGYYDSKKNDCLQLGRFCDKTDVLPVHEFVSI